MSCIIDDEPGKSHDSGIEELEDIDHLDDPSEFDSFIDEEEEQPECKTSIPNPLAFYNF